MFVLLHELRHFIFVAGTLLWILVLHEILSESAADFLLALTTK